MNLTSVLSNAGRSFLRAFGASIIVYAPGILAAPNLDGLKAVGVAAVVGSVAAGLRAIQDFVPQLQFGSGKLGDYAGSFTRAFLAAFLVNVIGILSAPDLNVGRSVAVAAITGALTAGFLAIQKLGSKVMLPTTAPAGTPPAGK